jgi:proline iminopeptidase
MYLFNQYKIVMAIMEKLQLVCMCVLILQGCRVPEDKKDLSYDVAESLVQTGGVEIVKVKTKSGDFNIWTKQVGRNASVKVLVITGGPGLSHEYAEAFESFFPKEGIEIIYYDQLGTGYSDNPNDTSLFNVARSVDEVEQVRSALGLDASNLYIWGHSWGGVVAMEYALKHQDKMKALIVSNMMASAADYNRYATNVLGPQMPPEVLASLRKIEAEQDFANPKYMELLMPHFYAQHICRLQEGPEPLTRSLSKLNHSFYVTMQGPSEFGLSGKLSQWDVKEQLPTITIPVLTIGAQHDSMDPKHMEWIASQVKNGSYLYCPNGSHMAIYDDQQVYMTGLIRFIKAVDAGEKIVKL